MSSTAWEGRFRWPGGWPSRTGRNCPAQGRPASRRAIQRARRFAWPSISSSARLSAARRRQRWRADLLVRVGKREAVPREGALAVPGQCVEAARRIGKREGGDGGRGFRRRDGLRPGRAGEAEIYALADDQKAGGLQLLDGGRGFSGAGFRRLDFYAPRGDDDQPAGGGFGGAQQAQDFSPGPARQRFRAALVQPGMDEQHRDDAQKRVAVAGDGSGPVECVSLRVGHRARVGDVAVRWISFMCGAGWNGSRFLLNRRVP